MKKFKLKTNVFNKQEDNKLEPSKQITFIYWKHRIHHQQITVQGSSIFCHQNPTVRPNLPWCTLPIDLTFYKPTLPNLLHAPSRTLSSQRCSGHSKCCLVVSTTKAKKGDVVVFVYMLPLVKVWLILNPIIIIFEGQHLSDVANRQSWSSSESIGFWRGNSWAGCSEYLTQRPDYVF